ncbi:hypothetical protein EVAR_36063_1 [Eumeta japonica]|uniref:Uncharacterized protein n=1 Tax=Eumeta variegata TaxID=151549 RepID=A0A4C1ZH86_EUMVA|nr:hypothetical protein EVAR_36063_1 [Eumeta japonica]
MYSIFVVKHLHAHWTGVQSRRLKIQETRVALCAGRGDNALGRCARSYVIMAHTCPRSRRAIGERPNYINVRSNNRIATLIVGLSLIRLSQTRPARTSSRAWGI